MRALRPVVLALALFTASLAAPTTHAAASGNDAAKARPKTAETPVVTQKNLLASERFWPYRVSLTAAWQPPGREKPLAAGEAGVLVRIGPKSLLARIDFGGLGVHETPVDRTDLIESANRIRLGQQGKLAPNFVTAIGPRLLDSATDPPTGLRPETMLEPPGFLCVFADPTPETFGELAKALAPLSGRHGIATVLFPQGAIPDPKVWARLRSLGWQVPFVYDHLTEGYTDSLLPAKTPMPALLLQTREGRVLFQSGWRPGLETSLRAKIEASFRAPPTPTSETSAAPGGAAGLSSDR